MSVIHPSTLPKAADVLAGRLREQILRGDLAEGSDLPTERDLGEQAGVSRATVREALRILDSEGLIDTRVGRNGGSFVARPTSAGIEHSVEIFIRGQRIRLDAVLEARWAIEPASARFAALHRTEDDLAELERCQQALEQAAFGKDIALYVRANLDWHVQVVRSSHNELMIAFIAAVAQPVYEASDVEGFSSPGVRQAVIRAHASVLDAIRARDADAAERRMARHVGAYIADLQKLAPRGRAARREQQ